MDYTSITHNRNVTFIQEATAGFIGYIREYKVRKFAVILFTKPPKTLETAIKKSGTTEGRRLDYRWDRRNTAIFALKNAYENSLKGPTA